MTDFANITKKDIKELNTNWPKIPDHLYRTLIIGGIGLGKNSLFNLTNQQPDIDRINLNAKDLYKAKYLLSICNKESTGLKHFNDSKTFIRYSNDKDDIYKNIGKYNLNKKT